MPTRRALCRSITTCPLASGSRSYTTAREGAECGGSMVSSLPRARQGDRADDIDAISIVCPTTSTKYAVMALGPASTCIARKPGYQLRGALRIRGGGQSGKVAQMVFNNRHFPAVMRPTAGVRLAGWLLSFRVVYNHASILIQRLPRRPRGVFGTGHTGHGLARRDLLYFRRTH